MAQWEPAGTIWRKKQSAWPAVVVCVIVLIVIGAAIG
jgi:hypothetical protein